ncbi:MAG: TonB-dependent receptor [Dysgonamonadaceae bacterium]|jgi:outer membrane cobalamin receptor|nr:TonB-dependent receptor [Dysgonamonadaceae bacterium]
MVLILIFCFSVLFQDFQDTVKVRNLEEVEVRANRSSAAKSAAPVQVIRAIDFEKTGALQVSDAARHFAGVQIKDYGGVGGLKTISLRSLGAAHTSVVYDGIPVSDYQTGQIDLGRFSLDNVEQITLNIGESDNIFQPANIQMLAGAINIVAKHFVTDENEKIHLISSIKGGSFGLFNPSLFVGKQFSKSISSSLSADYMQSDGNYPFRQAIGLDSIANRKRQNSAVKSLKSEWNIHSKLASGGSLSMKTRYFLADRRLPGPAIYYNDYSTASLKDDNLSVQVAYLQSFNEKTDFKANAKFDYNSSNYSNERQYRYVQREYYADAVVLRQLNDNFSFSWANDLIYANLSGNTLNSATFRTTVLSAFSGKFDNSFLSVTGKVLYTYADDKQENALNKFSSYLGFSAKPLNTNIFRIRAFYKKSFRLPTLADLYYSPVGKRNLKPENAQQFNIGLTFGEKIGLLAASFSVDAYKNTVKDKLIAYPTNDMNIWTILNIGKTDIRGLDLKTDLNFNTGSDFRWKLLATYTFQQVLNHTNPANADYNKQIPYTPRHAASGWLSLETPIISVNYTLIFSGKRYSEASNRPESQMKPFAEHGLSLSRSFRVKLCRFTVSADCINLTDAQYEIVKSYPMQGRSVIVKLKIEL